MSGIAGIWSLEEEALDPRWLDEMLHSLAHRGLDGECSRPFKHVALGQFLQRRLKSKPSHDGLENLVDRQVVICADVRLDNREELVAELSVDRFDSGSITDEGLILRAYELWGTDCPERLLGDFAFAIWDRREHMLFCARDRFGVRPFYYARGPGQRFAFASELKALLRLPWIEGEMDEKSVAAYLANVYADRTSTFYRNIRRLPPASRMLIGAGSVSREFYWELDPLRTAAPATPDEYAEGFLELFRAAVDRRVDDQEPMALALSGGLDSSAVTCMTRSLLPVSEVPELLTISATFQPGSPGDERRYIDAITKMPGYRSVQFRADVIPPLKDVERVFDFQDEPFFAPNHFILWKLMQCSREAGARVLLDGHDGDTTVSHGLWRLNELARQFRLGTLFHELHGLGSHIPSLRPTWRTFWRYMLEDGIRPRTPAALRRLIRPLRRRHTASSDGSSFLRAGLLKQTGLDADLREMRRSATTDEKTARCEHFLRLDQGFIPFALEVIGRSAAAFGLEPRYPFFDSRLVEYCLALPADQKLEGGLTRIVMRRGLRGVVPEEILRRPDKADLGHNFRRALFDHEGDRLRELLIEDPGPLLPYVDPSGLRAVHDRFLRTPCDHDAMILWRSLTLALWLRRRKPVTGGVAPSRTVSPGRR